MNKLKLYDFNGVLVSVDKFREYLKQSNPDLYHTYYIEAEKDIELKRKFKNIIRDAYDYATDNGLYEMSLIPGAVERLRKDHELGYSTGTFTTMRLPSLVQMLDRLGINGELNHIVPLEEIALKYKMGIAVKESPDVYVAVARHMHEKGCSIETYVDDSETRVKAVLAANPIIAGLGIQPVQRLYHFSLKNAEAQMPGYMAINELMKVE
jgi:phosphoglycolate phosphatase-like HAD superfamily hydrolase